LLIGGVGARATTARAGSTSVAAVGSLDCNGHSPIQAPIKHAALCTDFRLGAARGEDNGVYIGHDEPDMNFNSTVPGSGNHVQWKFRLPVDHSLPSTQTFENQIAFWFSMALCDPGSYPQNHCIPNSDANHSGTFDPTSAGSAFLETQFYPPGDPPFISRISCDTKHWCASLHINSLECTEGFAFCNNNCIEPTDFGFIQDNGVPTGPAGPENATAATYTPNAHTLMMNPGDVIMLTIHDSAAGLVTAVNDLTTHKTGFMTASAANGFQSLNVNTCAARPFAFHPEFSTAKDGNYVPWAALQANVGFSPEIGHFTAGLHGDGDKDDAPCFKGPLLPGCLNFRQGGDIDFDGNSYLADWPDGTQHNATPVTLLALRPGTLGPLSKLTEGYTKPFPQMQFETDVLASESTCKPSGHGCTVPPQGAAFYPFFAKSGTGDDCSFTFGNDIAGSTVNDYGKDAQYGSPNLPWFFGTASSGIRTNPCPGA
jgi:hypothetical protein